MSRDGGPASRLMGHRMKVKVLLFPILLWFFSISTTDTEQDAAFDLTPVDVVIERTTRGSS